MPARGSKHRLLVLAMMAVAALWGTSPAAAAKPGVPVVVVEPYLELHTGPGRGYPVFHVAARGDEVEVLKRRTDWFRVRVPRGEEGWVPLAQLRRTQYLDGTSFDVPAFDIDDLAERRWETGVLYGDFGGANAVSVYGAFGMTPNLAIELWLSHVLGRYSDSRMAHLNVVHMLFPERRFSPYLTLGGGVVETRPKATLVESMDRSDPSAHAGAGLRAYLTRRFVFRAEYKTYVVFTSRDDNEEIREWKAGFSFFF